MPDEFSFFLIVVDLGFCFPALMEFFLPELTTLGDCALEFQQSDSRLCLVCNSYFICASVACAVGPSVTLSSTDFTFQNVVFGNLFEFSVAEITFKSISPTL